YFEVALLEETVMRAMKRASEADYLLLTISANGPAGYADESLYRIAKNYWNIHDHRRALEFIDNLYSRFPESARTNDARYMEARILEEMQEQTEAIAVYRDLSQASVTAKLRFA